MQNLNENYLEKGWIDSLKFISLVTDIELKFSITFSNDMFQNKAFTTIGGLIHIIDSEVNGKIYEIDKDEEVGDEIGVFENSKPRFYK